MNPDRATLNFLNSFPEESRNRGDDLQQEGAVTQIFGNHLFIQGRVEDKSGVYRTSLRLQGNRWFGSCTAEDDIIAGACMYATMMERMHRGEDLPESPNEFDDTPIIDLIEETLDRELDDSEADFITKLEKRYRRYVIEGEIHDHDMVRLNPRWEIVSYEPLELWPIPPGDILEFWNYLAYAFYKKKLPYAEFMNAVTNLKSVQKKMQDWEKEREVAEWYDRIELVNDRPPQEKPLTINFRIVSTINEAKVEVKEGDGDGEWIVLREKNDIDRLAGLFEMVALRMDAPSQLIWEHFLAFYNKEGAATMDLETEEACRFMNRLFHQKALKGHIVNLDEREYKVSTDKINWICEDDPYYPDAFALQLMTKEKEYVSHSVRLLPGREELYQSDETVFPGPPRWLNDTEVMPRYMIPKEVINSLEGVEFLRKIGSKLPESLRKRVIDLDLYPRFQMRIEQGLTAAETEHLVIDIKALEKKDRRIEKLVKDGWELVEQKPVKGKQLLRFARENLYPVPGLLGEMGLTYDDKLDEFKSRVTKLFPEKFSEWAKAMPKSVEVEMDFKLKTLLADPVAAAVRFEVVNQDIDWFDLRIVIDVEGVNLTKSQIRQLVAARGGYVRMEDGGWMRLEIKLDDDQRDAVIRLGLDPFDLSGETHRMHALQLADPKAAEVFDPKAWKKIKDTAKDIQIDIDVSVPDGLQATLRPYQVEGFHFLAYLATNRFGGILADDMGLGKTIQSLTYILWLRLENGKEKNSRNKPALVVCPKSVLDVWATEAEKFAPELRVKVLRTKDDLIIDEAQNDLDLVVLNYAQLRVCGEDLNTIRWLTVILDEGQQIKNPDSKAAKSARELNASNRLVLTGTPIENRLMDMWSLMAFAMPGVLGSKAYFKKRFDKRKDPTSQQRLASRLRPFLLRRTKLQVAKDLPPRTEEEVFAVMEGVQAEMYKNELKRIQKALLGVDSDESVKKNSFAILQGLMRLRQICCHPGLIDPKFLKEESAKMIALFYLLDQLKEENHKVLVFSQFVSMLDIIKARLETESRAYNYLTGQTKDRKGEIENFQTTKHPSVFMLSLKAGGAGLNLTSASYVILYDPWWNPAVENQAIDRTHRIGQKNKVIAYRLLTRNTVEEKIRVLQHQKTALVTNVLGDEGFASNLDMDDLQFILGHDLEHDDEMKK